MRRIGLIVCAILAIAATAWAQTNDPSVTGDNIEMVESGKPILEYALAGGFLLAALAIGFKPSRKAAD